MKYYLIVALALATSLLAQLPKPGSQQGGGAGGGGDVFLAGTNTYTGDNSFAAAAGLTLKRGTAAPTGTECDAAGELGRVYIRYGDPASVATRVYTCQQTGASTYGWLSSTYSQGLVAPTTCDPGDLFFDLNAAAGSNWLGCTATDTWTLLSGAGGGVASLQAQTGALTFPSIGTTGTAPAWSTLTLNIPLASAAGVTAGLLAKTDYDSFVAKQAALSNSAGLASALSDEVGSAGGGLAVFNQSPTIVTPTIASFANAAHNHTNAAGGAQLTDAALSAAIGYAKGGTGLTAAPANGQLLIGNGSGYTLAELTGGANITITPGVGSITIAASGSTGYGTVLNEASALTQRASLNFIGAGIDCVDNSGATRTDCTVITSGATDVPGLTDQKVTRTNSTTIDVAAGACGLGSVVSVFASAATVTTSAGSDTLRLACDLSTGTPRLVLHKGSVTATCSGQSCNEDTATAFGDEEIPLATSTVTSGAVDVGGITNLRALNYSGLIVRAGAFMTPTTSGGIRTLAFDSAAFLGAVNVWTTKQTFTPVASLAGINFGSIAGDVTSGLVNGDCWYNSTASKFRCRENGSTVDMIGGAGTAAWQALTNTADAATSYLSNNTAETVIFSFESAFGASQQFLIRQQTGNPTGGTLVDIRAADADVTVLRVGDGTNGVKVSQAGALTVEGTGSIVATSFLGLTGINSGGIPYGSASNVLSSSAALGTDQLVVGGGAGGAPITDSGLYVDRTNKYIVADRSNSGGLAGLLRARNTATIASGNYAGVQACAGPAGTDCTSMVGGYLNLDGLGNNYWQNFILGTISNTPWGAYGFQAGKFYTTATWELVSNKGINWTSSTANFGAAADTGMERLGAAVVGANTATAGTLGSFVSKDFRLKIPNAGTVGTTVKLLAKLDASGNALITATSDVTGALGCVVAGAGTTGSAYIVTLGEAICTADNSITIGDYVGIGTTTAGRIKSLGATKPTSNIQILGRSRSTVSAGQDATIVFYPDISDSNSAGDNLSRNGSALADADFDDATPAAPANSINVKWQSDAGTPNNISAYVPYAAPLTVSGGNLTVLAASTTVVGASELATTAETTTGTDAARTVTPDGLAHSVFGGLTFEVPVFDFTVDVATGNGKAYFIVTDRFNGMNLTAVNLQVITAGTTGATSVQVTRCAAAASGNACSGTTASMLTTVVSVDSGENSSDTAATAAVIDTSNDDVATAQVIRIDVTAVSTTAPKGMILTLTFARP